MAGVKGRSGGWNRKPIGQHVLEGTHRRDRHGDRGGNLAMLPVQTSAAAGPESREARRLLRGLSRPSRTLGRTLLEQFEGWSPADLAVLRLLLSALDRAAACRELIDAEGLMPRRKHGGPRPHPLLRAERQAATFAVNAFKQLNLGGLK